MNAIQSAARTAAAAASMAMERIHREVSIPEQLSRERWEHPQKIPRPHRTDIFPPRSLAVKTHKAIPVPV
jgi:hypothetical protein